MSIVAELPYPPLQQQWFDSFEAAAYLRISHSTLETYRRLKMAPRAHRVTARCLRYSRADLDAWLSSYGEDVKANPIMADVREAVRA